MSTSRRAWAALAALALLAGASHAGLRRAYALPWPGLGRLVLGADALQDVSFTVAGFRRAAADVAWIQFLHAIAVDMHGHEDEDEHGHGHDHPEVDRAVSRGSAASEARGAAEGTTAGVRDAALRVARLDPGFVKAYLFGAGVLAFDYSEPRPAEALDLLREGIERNPQDRSLQLVTAAILYKVRGQSGSMLEELEKLALEPDCPGLMRAILANLYRREGLYAKAAAMWRLVLEGRSSSGERERAAKELAALSKSRG